MRNTCLWTMTVLPHVPFLPREQAGRQAGRLPSGQSKAKPANMEQNSQGSYQCLRVGFPEFSLCEPLCGHP